MTEQRMQVVEGSAPRKALSKKLRFEVFKRDSFTCQYCGKSAPDVILECDHISPVSKGGTNDILNLITSCKDCNAGKSNIELDDQSVLAKQKQQLNELSERRSQLEMMVQWREGLKAIDEDTVSALIDQIDEALVSSSVNENGRKSVRQWLKKYGYQLVSECIEISANQYLRFDEEDSLVDGCAEKFFSMVPRIASNKQKFGDNTEMQALYYARGILRNRISYCDDRKAIDWLQKAYAMIEDVDHITEIVKTGKNWTEFRKIMSEIVGEDL